MTAFELLSEPIRKFIRDKGWSQLRPIQQAAIAKILSTSDNYILAARTASGKTEAAFLPILTKVDFSEHGVKVLYISPLIALINDQFSRIEELCKHLDITVTKWHGEANKSLKNKLIQNPNGIVLITPESLEALFVNKPFFVKQLFSNLQYVVVDEIHSFIGTDRGVQLKSILSRLNNMNNNTFSIVGLSATIGDYNEAKRFTGNEVKTKVLLDKSEKETNVIFRYFKNETNELPIELLKDLYIETKDSKVLIFPNSRGRTEEVAVKLKKISDKVGGHSNYFSHHSSVDKEVREYVEYFAKNNYRYNFCISCTSTLELGIDIGTVDKIVQIDATYSISSLIQRIGRSGRKEGESSNLALYATEQWSFLQSLACWLLYKEGFIESPEVNDKPYDILLHQSLSIVKEHSGIALCDLLSMLKNNTAFINIEIIEIEEIVQHLIANDILEKIQHEIIIGIEGEKIVNNQDFYSVFKTEENFKVINAGKTIGEVPFSLQIIENENILLAARIWKIKFIDQIAKKIDVIPANDGKKPMFFGSGGIIHPKIREKMLEILFVSDGYDFLDQPCCEVLEELRKDFSFFKISNIQLERPLLEKNKQLQFFSFEGTKVNRTIQLLFNIICIQSTLDESSSSFTIDISKEYLFSRWNCLAQAMPEMDAHIAYLLKTNPTILKFSKWGDYLSEKYKIRLLKDRYFDFEQTCSFLTKIKLVDNT
ncbi:ATP-dependent helicase [Bacteroidia bacterium]|nr:ATP-dependent helicase [Bacteroidia bacterium]